MLRDPSSKYRPFPQVNLPGRQWPSRTITKAPRWLSTDMRDGNQALIDPMDAEKKTRFFELLCKVGLKEIEVGFPSAGATEFDFISGLVQQDRIPDDVIVQVLTQSRQDLIETSFQSLKGAKKAIVHLYNAVSPAWRRIVFGMSREEVKGIAVAGAKVLRDEAAKQPDTDWHFEYSPETFSTAELDFSVEVCEAVMEVLRPSPERRAEYAALIRGSGEHLLEIVSSILDAARIESGAFAVSRRTCALAPIVDTCVNLLAMKSQAGGVTVSVEAAADTPDVDADPRAMTQVALNLLANAVKFTPRGGRVAVTLGRSRGGVALSVRDTGCGIAPEHIARLGEAFFRAEDGVVREGTGLGLSVVRGLVALHGGELDVQSALGQGTTVTVFLPPAEAAAPIPIGRAPANDVTDERAKRRA